MAAEIAEQPAVLRRLVAERPDVHEAVRRILPAELRGVALVGRGSSENALVFARYAFEVASGRPATFVAPSIHSLYRVDVDYRGHLAVGASQSGQTPEIVEAVRRLGASGAATVALTSEPGSPLAEAADLVLYLRSGRERSIPATKTFTAQLALAAMAAEVCGPVPWSASDWALVPEIVGDVVADSEAVRRVAAQLHDAPCLATVARGFLLATARESALKLQETALIAAIAHSAASFRHGPIAAAGAGFPVIVLSAPGPAAADLDELVADLRGRAVPVFVIGPGSGADVSVPAALPEALMAFPMAVRVQQLALALAEQRGLNPDAPRGLEKVTRT